MGMVLVQSGGDGEGEEVRGMLPEHSLSKRRSRQNFRSIPACFSTPFAVCRDMQLRSTVNRRPEIGLYQSSWSPFAMRS